MKSRTILKMAYVGSKTRSLGQILEKTLFTLYRPHFQFNNHETWSECFLDEISDAFELGHVGSKTRSQGQMLETLCMLYRPRFQSYNHETRSEFCHDEILNKFEKVVMSSQKLSHQVKC